MIKLLVSVLTALSFSSSVFAIENLGADCELSFRTDSRFSVSAVIKIKLEENQILVRGDLEDYYEHGFEGQTSWSIFDEFYERKILQDPWDNRYALRKGDRVFILAESGHVMVSGYYRERKILHRAETKNVTYTSTLNVPGLFKDPEMTESVISSQKLRDLFSKGASAVLVRTMKPGEKERLVEHLGPLLIKHYSHMMSAGRYIKLNETTTLEIAHFERTLQGKFSYKLSQVAALGFDNKQGTLFRLPAELTIVPYLTADGESAKQTLLSGDIIVMLDFLGNVVHREKISYFQDHTGMLSTYADVPGRTLKDMLDKAKRTTRVIVIRRVI